MIVTIDGPAGAGKSTLARRLAQRLGFEFLDTGALYRGVAWAAMQAQIDVTDPDQVTHIARQAAFAFDGQRLMVNGQDVTEAIRTPDVTTHIRFAASNPDVREILTQIQRRIGQSAENLVTEGRDQGTTVFPHAECKIFLTASAEERAQRRHEELLAKGESVSLDEVLESQNQRDAGDQARSVGPLAQAADATELVTDGMSVDEVLGQLEKIVRAAGP